ncbi:hypothetical protein B0H65DRAFT_168919 [Neurospora tetraspora]|uniref:Only prolin and serin are matching in the corresponding protein n=1 Tax=Neurospora tetraspora TaxID=94610 RepID=A0AAE0MT43_9PEZI|nr:hypothetical protein B0H65DRAFT_168919 [Neurospora tetraspora]
MPTRLIPLQLPQKVERERARMLELLQYNYDADHSSIYYTHNSSSSSSDIASPLPITPTFSRPSHSRYSGSTSSLENIMPPNASSECPISPLQQTHPNKANKTQLPDVQEEPLERDSVDIYEDEDEYDLYSGADEARLGGLYDCLCDEACSHHNDVAQSITTRPSMTSDFDYDLGFLSDTEFSDSSRSKKRRHGSDAGMSSWSSRIGSKLPSFSRWGSTSRRNQFASAPASVSSLVQRPSISRNFSRAASSRSSSISASMRRPSEQLQQQQQPQFTEPPLPTTPALSFYGSPDETVSPASPLEDAQAAAGKSLERERALAATPLLPPLFTESPPTQGNTQSLQTSPLQSPTVASYFPDIGNPQHYPTPPLSTKASVASFRRATIASTISELPSPLPFLEDQDAWSDRLGHANFTIEPRPYVPDTADLATYEAFRADWNQARINFTKHLVRTGEHYGLTSITYGYTQEKWAEIEQEWSGAEEDLIQRLEPQLTRATTTLLRRATEDVLPAAVPEMLTDEGKFPDRGDVDIVGPMVRDAVMAGHDDKKNSASLWLKNLVDKVGRRK